MFLTDSLSVSQSQPRRSSWFVRCGQIFGGLLFCLLLVELSACAQVAAAPAQNGQPTIQGQTDKKNNASDAYDRFQTAVENDQGKVVAELLKKGASPDLRTPNGETMLMLAARQGNIDAMTALLKAGASPNLTSPVGDTALMTAAISGQKKAAELLLRYGAEVNRSGWTPLIYAATGGNDDIIDLLLDQLADIDARSPNGTTALMMAVRQGNESTVRLLIDKGANVNLRNETGASAMEWARRGTNSAIVDYLRRAGAK